MYRDFSLEMGDTDDSKGSVLLEKLLNKFFGDECRELACDRCKNSSATAFVCLLCLLDNMFRD